MQVVDAHKGPVRWQVDVKGRAAHSSMATLGVNAITYAARLVGEIERIEAGLKRTARNERFDPPYPTLQVTKTRRGNGNEYRSCRLQSSASRSARCPVSIRLRSKRGCGTSPRRECLPEMRAVAPEADITITQTNAVPPFGAERELRGRSARLEANRPERDAHRLVRDRSRPLSGCRRPVCRLRTRRHRASAHGGRMDRRKRDHEVHGVSRTPRRVGGKVITIEVKPAGGARPRLTTSRKS